MTKNLSNMLLRVAAVNFTNFFELRKTKSGHYEGVSGIEYSFLKLLSTTLMFVFQVVTPSDGVWGNQLDNGNWTGMMGMLQANTADIALDAIHPTIERMKIAKFSFPYAIDRNRFAMLKAGMASKDFVYFRSFEPVVWITLITTVLSCSALLAQLHNIHLTYSKKQKKQNISILSTMEIILGYRDQKRIGKHLSVRILLAACGLGIQVMKYSFVGVFLSLLMNPVMDSQIETFAELAGASRQGRCKVVVREGVGLEEELRTAKSGTFRDLGEHLRKHPESSYADESAIARIMEGYVVVNSGNYLKMKIEASEFRSKIFLSDDGLNIMTSVIAFRKDFCCMESFNKIMAKIQQGGLHKKIVDDHVFYLFSKIQNREPEIDPQSPRPISLRDLNGVFWVVLAGYLLAFMALIFEKCSLETKTYFKTKLS